MTSPNIRRFQLVGAIDPIYMGDDIDSDQLEEGGVLTKKRVKVKLPPRYKVLLHNDDYTTMEFVIGVLTSFFGMSRDDAEKVMLHVHQEGVGLCGIYTFEVAEAKVEQVIKYSISHGHPLECTMESE
jgi:ATP-dependent Clp protease adaptor protein ClpS